MTKLKQYLKNSSKHLFKVEGKETFYQKMYVKGDTLYVLTLDEDFNIKNEKTYDINRYERVSSKGKEYISEIIKYILFPKHDSWNPPSYRYKRTSIKHFKKIKEVLNKWEQNLDETKQAA